MKTIQDFLWDPSKKEKIKKYLSQFPDDQKQAKLTELSNAAQRRSNTWDSRANPLILENQQEGSAIKEKQIKKTVGDRKKLFKYERRPETKKIWEISEKDKYNWPYKEKIDWWVTAKDDWEFPYISIPTPRSGQTLLWPAWRSTFDSKKFQLMFK